MAMIIYTVVILTNINVDISYFLFDWLILAEGEPPGKQFTAITAWYLPQSTNGQHLHLSTYKLYIGWSEFVSYLSSDMAEK